MDVTEQPVDPTIQSQIERLIIDYAHTIDDDELATLKSDGII